MPIPWFSYDHVAERYASAAEPAYFARPAEDLISLLRPAAGMKLLDVGAGSGAVATAVMRFEPRTTLVACDLSVPMLAIARVRFPELRSVAADLIHLPFADAACDAVTLGFVLSHLASPVAALREIRRVLNAGGRVAISNWSTSAAASPAGELWRRTAERYIPAAELDEATAIMVPSENALATAEALRATFASAGFAAIAIHERDYSVQMRTDDFIQSRFIAALSRYMHARLSPAEWNDFVTTVSRQLFDELGAELSFHTAVNIGIARQW